MERDPFGPCVICDGDLQLLTIDSSALNATSIVAAELVAGNTLTKAVVDTIFSQSSSLGSEYTGAWTSPTALVINVTTASTEAEDTYHLTKTDTFKLTVIAEQREERRHNRCGVSQRLALRSLGRGGAGRPPWSSP